MKYTLLRCCTTPIVLQQYEWSTNAVLEKLGIGLVDVKELGCCGYPLRNVNFKAYVISSARNLALSERENLDLLTVCNCCYGTMKHIEDLLHNDGSIRKEVNATLAKEGLVYEGNIKPKHILQVLYDDIGIEAIRKQIVHTFKGLNIATHYGCRILRPSKLIKFDKPYSPTKFDELVEVTGARSVDWLKKHECCGSPLWGSKRRTFNGFDRKQTEARQEIWCGFPLRCLLLLPDSVRSRAENTGLSPGPRASAPIHSLSATSRTQSGYRQ